MSLLLINGELCQNVPVSDRALQYGDGVFETIRVAHGKPTLWARHRQRLQEGCVRLGIPVDMGLIEADLDRLLESAPHDGVAKLIVSRGSGGRGYAPPTPCVPQRILQFFDLPPLPWKSDRRGAQLFRCRHPVSINPALAGIKHLNRLDQVLASAELSAPFDEGIMSTATGDVIEGTRCNLFLVHDGGLQTPDLRNAGVAGVMRAHLLDRFSAAGIGVTEARIDLASLQSATELFLCNSVIGVWPVASLKNNNQAFQYQTGRLTGLAIEFADEVFAN